MLRRGFRPSRLGAAVMAMISPASGVWTLLFDDLSLVIFRQPTMTTPLIYQLSATLVVYIQLMVK